MYSTILVKKKVLKNRREGGGRLSLLVWVVPLFLWTDRVVGFFYLIVA
jgi:hypothetical protein